MTEKRFANLVREIVLEYANKRLDVTDDSIKLKEDDIYIIAMSKVLQNNKAYASTILPDGMCYVVTYNGDKQECYVDAYKKWENFVVGVVDDENQQTPLPKPCKFFNKEYGKTVCYGTREKDECTCGGDKQKCDFYPLVRSEKI